MISPLGLAGDSQKMIRIVSLSGELAWIRMTSLDTAKNV